MEYTSDIPLSLVSPNIWKGSNKSNGQLELIHNFHLAVGYASLTISAALAAELAAVNKAAVPFGNGLWYDRNILSTGPNQVNAGIPVAAGAIPELAGVLAYDAALASLQPANADGVMPYNKGKIIKRGFLRYKSGKVAAAGAAIDITTVDERMCLFFENSTGDPVFAVPTSYGLKIPVFTAAAVSDVVTALSGVDILPDGMRPKLANCTYAGKVIQVYPEEQSVLVALDY